MRTRPPAPSQSASPAVLRELASGPLADLAPPLGAQKGHQIGREGARCDHLYIVARGQVLLSRRAPDGEHEAMYLLGPGQLFGEGSLTPARRWLVDARAVSDCILHTLSAPQLPRLAQFFPALTAHIVTLLGQRLERAHRRLSLVRTASARDRLLGLLCLLAHEHGEPREGRIWVRLRLTQEELGQMVGLARETVARLLSSLQEEGVVRREGRGLLSLACSTVEQEVAHPD